MDARGRLFVPLVQVARVDRTMGPNLINRENVQRRIVVMANVAGRDIRSVIEDIRAQIARKVAFPKGYYLEYGGEFESEARASKTIGTLSLLAILAMVAILWVAFRSVRDALLERRILVSTAPGDDRVLRLLPPLTLAPKEAEIFVTALGEILEEGDV